MLNWYEVFDEATLQERFSSIQYSSFNPYVNQPRFY